jgi:hypothetical protein
MQKCDLMLHRTICFFSLLISVLSSNGQAIESGLFIGASNYIGDLSNNNSIVLSETYPSAAIIGRYNISEKWSLKGFFGYGKISGSDANATTTGVRARNLSFYTDIYEASLHLEFNLVRNSVRYGAKRKFIPYIIGGVGLFNFNPKADYAGVSYELMPLGTEGQGSTTYNDKLKYSLTQVCIPIGFGIRKKITPNFCIGAEIGFRYTLTNYLDDVGGIYGSASVIGRANGPIAKVMSDRSNEISSDGQNLFAEGNPRSFKSININDIYIMGGISFTYVIPNTGMRCPRF